MRRPTKVRLLWVGTPVHEKGSLIEGFDPLWGQVSKLDGKVSPEWNCLLFDVSA